MVNVFAVPVFFICFRETLETGIIVSVLLSFLKQALGPDRDPAVYKTLVRQVWLGTGIGVLICLIIGASLIGAFYSLGKNVWSGTETIWEAVFALVASIIITLMGAALLRISKLQDKWRVKLAKALAAKDSTRVGSAGSRFKVWLERYAMFTLPFITVVREGLEAVVFIGGVGLGFPASSFPLPVITGIACGALISYFIYKGGNYASIQLFLIVSTCLLYLIAAGLMSKSVWLFEANKWNGVIGGDASETGSGPGSYDFRQSVWHVNCCNPKLNGGGGWGIFNAIFGWQNSATYGSVISYNLYWVVVIAGFIFMRFQETKAKRSEKKGSVSSNEGESASGMEKGEANETITRLGHTLTTLEEDWEHALQEVIFKVAERHKDTYIIYHGVLENTSVSSGQYVYPENVQGLARGYISCGRGMVPSVVNIDPNGDLILHVNHQDYINQSYRVSITVLRSTSKYFDSLLDPAKFREGRAVQERCNELSQRYSNTAAIPPAELPRVTILDLGQIPLESESATVLQHFLRVLHNATTPSSIPRTHFLAILVLIADRFDAVQAVAKYIAAHGWMRDPTDHDHQFKEVLVRQKILIGHIVRSSTWLGYYSACLIREGSRCWTPSSVDMADEAAWWHLPHGIEEELLHRRRCILNTIGSLQSHFIHLYISKQRQCKLGYDSSPQCDLFQLGQMVRFFVRKGTMGVPNTFGAAADPQPFTGHLDGLISLVRELPTYQMDPHHVHCGPRTRLEPILASLATFPRIGICLGCWERGRDDSWLDHPRGGHWEYRPGKTGRGTDQCQLHQSIKAMYTADERDWTPPV